MKPLSKVLDSKVQGLAPQFTKELRSLALSVGWPPNVVSQLTVKVTSKDINVEYPDAIASDVNNLEYGTYGIPPKPVLRTFLDKRGDLLPNELAEPLVDELMELI
jgi:hypothetical protein